MSGLPNNWTTAKLDDLAEDISYGYTASSTKESVGPHLLRITDIQENNVSWSSVPYCEIDSKRAQKYLLKENDLLFARTGATVGKSFLIKGEIPEAVFASYLIRVRCLQPEAASYLAYYFRSQDYWRQITEFSAGIGQPNVNGSKLKELNIPLPPLAEQTRIAAKLDELLAQVDTLKARIDAIPALLKRFRQSVLAAAVSGRLTEEWREGKEYCAESLMLADLVDNSLVGLVRSSADQSESAEQRVPYLKMNNIGNDWGVSLDSLVYVSVSEAETEKYYLKDGDWLFNTRNSQELVGKSCVWRGGSRLFVFNNNILRARFSDRTVPDFIEIWFRSPSGREALEKVKSATTSVAAVYQKALMSQMIPLPEIAEQTEIVRRVEQLFAFADQLEAKVASAKSRIDHLTQSILAKAFRGELVPQDPNDEPASALLERIQAQRAAAPKAKRGRKASA